MGRGGGCLIVGWKCVKQGGGGLNKIRGGEKIVGGL